jgi:hypothetical protein
MLLRMYWDGNPRPAVEAPVGDFFANCFGKRGVKPGTPPDLVSVAKLLAEPKSPSI